MKLPDIDKLRKIATRLRDHNDPVYAHDLEVEAIKVEKLIKELLLNDKTTKEN